MSITKDDAKVYPLELTLQMRIVPVTAGDDGTPLPVSTYESARYRYSEIVRYGT